MESSLRISLDLVSGTGMTGIVNRQPGNEVDHHHYEQMVIFIKIIKMTVVDMMKMMIVMMMAKMISSSGSSARGPEQRSKSKLRKLVSQSLQKDK